MEVSFNIRAALAEWANSLQAFNWQDPKKSSYDGSGKGNMSGGHRDRLDARLWVNYFLNGKSQFNWYFFATSLKNNMAEIYRSVNPGQPPIWRPGVQWDGNYDQTGQQEAYETGLSYSYKRSIVGRDFSLTLDTDYLWEKQKRDKYQLN
ncbi:MAG: hypothetical protein LBP22_00695 [Deltaproteobacteria bacterium]|nr:hypothetical protein [Deltaproteobacteria bacterium]